MYCCCAIGKSIYVRSAAPVVFCVVSCIESLWVTSAAKSRVLSPELAVFGDVRVFICNLLIELRCCN